jgi:hypothetical protein
MAEAAGETEMNAKLAAAVVTVRVAVPWTVSDWAVIDTEPAVEPVARPALLTLAMFESEELHCAVLVTSFVLPSER